MSIFQHLVLQFEKNIEIGEFFQLTNEWHIPFQENNMQVGLF